MTKKLRPGMRVLALGAAAAGLLGSPGWAAGPEAAAFVYTSGPTVMQAQGILQHLGFLQAGSYRRGEVDGPTVEALTHFQRTHALRQTGQIDGETLTQLLQHQPAATGGPLALHGVRFDLGSARLDSASLRVLDEVARSLKANPHVRVEIAGHADSTGAAAVNRRLSKARADAVRDYLVTRGVQAHRLEARGYGSRRPIADNDTRAGRAENRRVEISRLG